MDFEYQFKNIPNLRCDLSGNFFYKDEPIKKQWRPGQIFIKIENKRYGIKTLRKVAFKTIEDKIPF